MNQEKSEQKRNERLSEYQRKLEEWKKKEVKARKERAVK